MDPAEIGNNADAAFPGDGAGIGDSSLVVVGPFKPGAAAAAAADVGEDSGDRLPARQKFIMIQIRNTNHVSP